MPEIPAAWLALLGALFGGAGLKLLEGHLSKPKHEADQATAFRNELRTDVKELRAEYGRVQQEVVKWKDKYYALLEQYLTLMNGGNTPVSIRHRLQQQEMDTENQRIKTDLPESTTD